MNGFLKSGMIVVYAIVALLIGIMVFDAIADTHTLDFLRNARGGFLLSAVIMSGSILMLIGGVFSFRKYQTPASEVTKITNKGQVEYLNDVLKTANISDAERKNIERKIEELSK
jgi:hypothetical protein